MVSSIGCATVHGEKYSYTTLPRHYIAGIRENPQTVDLSKLAITKSNSDVIDVGDVIEVSIAAGLSEKDIVKPVARIDAEGYANIPQIGKVKLAGLMMDAAEAEIYEKCVSDGLYRDPNITVTMKHQRINRIIVNGAVKKPGLYELPRGQCDLVAAIAKAEGLDLSAGTQVVIKNANSNGLRSDRVASRLQNGVDPAGHSFSGSDSQSDIIEASGGSDTITVDLISATKNGTGGYRLDDGAVVYVEKRDPEPLYVLGLVNKPGRFEFPIAEEIRVLDAIALAGGVSSIAADKVFVLRRKPGAEAAPSDPKNPDKVKTFIVQLSMANAKQVAESNIRLQPGDTVSVEQTPITFVLELFRRFAFTMGGSVPLTGL